MSRQLWNAAFALSLIAVSAGAQTPSRPPPHAESVAPRVPTAAAAATLQRLSDQDAIRSLAFYYGRGNDAISLHHANRARGRELGEEEYGRAFTPDVRIEVYALGGATPISTTVGIPAWVAFVDRYYESNRYSSSLHLMSNFHIAFPDANTALVSNYASVPHFILASAKDRAGADTSVEYMICRYEYEAVRQADGVWKTRALKIYLDEIWRGSGFYPGGQASIR